MRVLLTRQGYDPLIAQTALKWMHRIIPLTLLLCTPAFFAKKHLEYYVVCVCVCVSYRWAQGINRGVFK